MDLKFKNNRKYPIKIVSEAQDGVVKVRIYGIKEEEDYDVKLESKETGIVDMETIYEEDETIAKGQEIVSQKRLKWVYK